jgi:hypothetical protein
MESAFPDTVVDVGEEGPTEFGWRCTLQAPGFATGILMKTKVQDAPHLARLALQGQTTAVRIPARQGLPRSTGCAMYTSGPLPMLASPENRERYAYLIQGHRPSFKVIDLDDWVDIQHLSSTDKHSKREIRRVVGGSRGAGGVVWFSVAVPSECRYDPA